MLWFGRFLNLMVPAAVSTWLSGRQDKREPTAVNWRIREAVDGRRGNFSMLGPATRDA
jgi:hypothetical protein